MAFLGIKSIEHDNLSFTCLRRHPPRHALNLAEVSVSIFVYSYIRTVHQKMRHRHRIGYYDIDVDVNGDAAENSILLPVLSTCTGMRPMPSKMTQAKVLDHVANTTCLLVAAHSSSSCTNLSLNPSPQKEAPFQKPISFGAKQVLDFVSVCSWSRPTPEHLAH